MDEFLDCPCCGGISLLIRDDHIFGGQIYTGRYQSEVAMQNHGFQIRCEKCGLQTCWWHHAYEAVEHWNKRTQQTEGILR